MKSPKDYPKALVALQFADTTLYIIAAVVIYRYAGQGVTSPALGSASPLLRKVAWGVAIPTVCSTRHIQRFLSKGQKNPPLI
jgi:hypothetical protein